MLWSCFLLASFLLARHDMVSFASVSLLILLPLLPLSSPLLPTLNLETCAKCGLEALQPRRSVARVRGLLDFCIIKLVGGNVFLHLARFRTRRGCGRLALRRGEGKSSSPPPSSASAPPASAATLELWKMLRSPHASAVQNCDIVIDDRTRHAVVYSAKESSRGWVEGVADVGAAAAGAAAADAATTATPLASSLGSLSLSLFFPLTLTKDEHVLDELSGSCPCSCRALAAKAGRAPIPDAADVEGLDDRDGSVAAVLLEVAVETLALLSGQLLPVNPRGVEGWRGVAAVSPSCLE